MPAQFFPKMLLVSVATLLISASFAEAAIIAVTRRDDRNVGCNAGDCSLREAITLANSQAGDDTISFSIPTPATITLTNGEIAITSDVVIDGPGLDALTFDGNGISRIFSIAGGPPSPSTSSL